MTEEEPAPGRGFYDHVYTLEEILLLLDGSSAPELSEEIMLTRVTLLRLVKKLSDQLDPADYRDFIQLVFTGAATIAHLLKAQKLLGLETGDDFAAIIGQALDELGDQLNIQL